MIIQGRVTPGNITLTGHGIPCKTINPLLNTQNSVKILEEKDFFFLSGGTFEGLCKKEISWKKTYEIMMWRLGPLLTGMKNLRFRRSVKEFLSFTSS